MNQAVQLLSQSERELARFNAGSSSRPAQELLWLGRILSPLSPWGAQVANSEWVCDFRMAVVSGWLQLG